MEKARAEAYEYFDRHIRRLPKNPDGSIKSRGAWLDDNDADAFRHAYVSGAFTQEYGEVTANVLGLLNEYDPIGAVSNSASPLSRNMDLWNNRVGRKDGKKTRGRNETYYDLLNRNTMTRSELVALIQAGAYPGYSVKLIRGVETPVSRRDGKRINNIG